MHIHYFADNLELSMSQFNVDHALKSDWLERWFIYGVSLRYIHSSTPFPLPDSPRFGERSKL